VNHSYIFSEPRSVTSQETLILMLPLNSVYLLQEQGYIGSVLLCSDIATCYTRIDRSCDKNWIINCNSLIPEVRWTEKFCHVILQFYVTKCPTRCNYTQFISSVNCSTCFRWFLHPSSGAQITVSTASGTGQPLLLELSWNVMAHGDAR